MDSFLAVSKTVEKAKAELKKKEDEISAREAKFEEVKQSLVKYPIESEIIDLNVGGKHFTTYHRTLCKHENTMLEAMFSGRHPMKKDAQGRYFIDRPGKPFEFILAWLQTDVLIMPKEEEARKQLRIELEYYGLKELLVGHWDSNILEKESILKLTEWLEEDGLPTSWTLCYQATRDGFEANKFHGLCDNKGQSLTLIKTTNGSVFGGYTSQSWDSNSSYKADDKAWIFSLKNPSQSPPLKMRLIPQHRGYAIQCNLNYGPTFGGGHDIYVGNQSNCTATSYSNLNHSFQANLTNGSNEAKTYLAGSYNFQTSEIEVFLKAA